MSPNTRFWKGFPQPVLRTTASKVSRSDDAIRRGGCEFTEATCPHQPSAGQHRHNSTARIATTRPVAGPTPPSASVPAPGVGDGSSAGTTVTSPAGTPSTATAPPPRVREDDPEFVGRGLPIRERDSNRRHWHTGVSHVDLEIPRAAGVPDRHPDGRPMAGANPVGRYVCLGHSDSADGGGLRRAGRRRCRRER